jgi:hypothetical protein
MQMRVEAQPMEEPKRKLARLEEFIPDTANGMIYDFGRFVSVYLNPRLIPKHVVRSTAKSIGGGYSRRRLDTEDAQ